MAYQWLTMRIGEEKDRRDRETHILAMLPGAVNELHGSLSACIDAVNAAFTDAGAGVSKNDSGMRATAAGGSVDIVIDLELPGFQVRRADGPGLSVRVGVLPGEKLYYFDVAADHYLSMEELTRRILDKILFPKLRD
jgi:hypothetical protein